MAARIRKIRHDDETRAKIKSAAIINRLTQGFEGKVELSAVQVSIGLGLLRKTLPDLATHVLEGSEENPIQVIERQVVQASNPNRSGL